MTIFGAKLLKAVRPGTKLAQQTSNVVRVTFVYSSQADFEKEMAARRRQGRV